MDSWSNMTVALLPWWDFLDARESVLLAWKPGIFMGLKFGSPSLSTFWLDLTSASFQGQMEDK